MRDELFHGLVKIITMCGSVFPSGLKTDAYNVIQILFESKFKLFLTFT
jgi:hypothetical protein